MTYNSDGTLQTKTLPTAYGLATETVTYFYDRLGQLRTMGGRDSYVGASSYSPFGELLQVSMGTTSGKLGFQTWYFDEGTRRLSRNVISNQAVAGSLLDANYTYDRAGNVTRLADNGGSSDIQCFTYDYQRQLKEAWTINSGNCATPTQAAMGTNAGAYWTSYTYDTVGNRLTRTDHVKTGTSNTVYTYTPGPSGAAVVPNGTSGVGGPHSVSSVSKKVGTAAATTAAYKYDAAGNMTQRATAEADTWDSEGELTSTKAGAAVAATNVYDAEGNRILRRDASGSATLYLDSTEIKPSGATKTSQRWYSFGSKIVATRTAAGVAMLAANDQNTGTVQMAATTAAYVKRRFDPFGAGRASTVSAGATWSGDRGFLDKPVDASGLTQVGARYYDSSLGRFISVDPILDTKNTMQANAYAYGQNNPITVSDPTGRDGCWGYECGSKRDTPPPSTPGGHAPTVPTPTVPPVVMKPLPKIDPFTLFLMKLRSPQDILVAGGKDFVSDATSANGLLSMFLDGNRSMVNVRRDALRRDVDLARTRRGAVRDSARTRLAQETGGTGKGTNELAKATKLSGQLDFASKVLGGLGIALTAYNAYEEEFDANVGKDHSDGRTNIKTGARTTGAVLLGSVSATLCVELGPGAVGCGLVGGWVGEKAGGFIGDGLNFVIYDSGIELNPVDWFK